MNQLMTLVQLAERKNIKWVINLVNKADIWWDKKTEIKFQSIFNF